MQEKAILHFINQSPYQEFSLSNGPCCKYPVF